MTTIQPATVYTPTIAEITARDAAAVSPEERAERMRKVRESGAISGYNTPGSFEPFSGISANELTFQAAIRLGKEWRTTL